MALEVRYRHESDHVVVTYRGTASVDEFLAVTQEVGADSVAWGPSLVMVDLRGVETVYTFTEQLRIGEAVARNFAHLRRIAAVVPPERITRVGVKVANKMGKPTGAFPTPEEALAWLRGP
ncbi:MAG TPA: STAS/SEC14 domain-containing protein [Ramlibacter sp.]|nr:STAS/SEC14 domain-containing protein [Ramlibacter sp.]